MNVYYLCFVFLDGEKKGCFAIGISLWECDAWPAEFIYNLDLIFLDNQDFISSITRHQSNILRSQYDRVAGGL